MTNRLLKLVAWLNNETVMNMAVDMVLFKFTAEDVRDLMTYCLDNRKYKSANALMPYYVIYCYDRYRDHYNNIKERLLEENLRLCSMLVSMCERTSDSEA